jgi:formylglycine-generating enzyme required for sulfatase activity
LFDLAGNVSEWVHDTYTNVPPDTSKVLRDPMGNNRGTGHLFKGSNYSSGRLKELRNAYRQTVDDKEPTIGFRIARYF